MARLSKHGRELLRIEKETNETAPDSLTTWNKKTRAYMSDGKVLQKFDVRFKPDQFRPRGEFYSYGWKEYQKKKATTTMAEYEAFVERMRTKAVECGWTIVSGGPAPVIISQSRIMRAVESGDSIGFCKACGAETDGVEPDARNYQCDSCGQHEVYGAEEMLVAG